MTARRQKLLILLLALAASRHAEAQLFILRTIAADSVIPDGGERLLLHSTTFGNGTIANLQVSLEIQPDDTSSGFNGDLFTSIGQGAGYSVLLNRPGKLTPGGSGYSDSGLNVTFSDDAANGDIHVYRQTLNGSHSIPINGALTGVWAPDGREVDPADVTAAGARTALLSSFSGASTDGEWRLFAADLSTGETHRIESWALQITTAGDLPGLIQFQNDRVRAEGAPRTITGTMQIEQGVTFEGPHALTFTGPVQISGLSRWRVENNTRLSGDISEAAAGSALIKAGPGVLTLGGPSTHTGGVIVEEGALALENTQGSATGSGTVRVDDGAVLTGQGSASGQTILRNGAIISPGAVGPGSVALGSVFFEGGSLYRFEMNQSSGTGGSNPGWDWLNVAGAITFQESPGSLFRLELHSFTLGGEPGLVQDFDASETSSWIIATAGGGITGFNPAFFEIDTSQFWNPLGNHGAFSVELQGNDLVLSFVPEPAHYALLTGISLLGFGFWRKRLSR